MTLQSQAQRAKQLQLTKVPGSRNHIFGTFGSKGDHYQIEVKECADTRQFGSMLRGVTVFSVDCQQTKANISSGKASMQVACKGNCQKHTICYHSQAALMKIFAGKEINFQRSISGEVARSGNISLVRSPSGGELWIVEVEAKTEEIPQQVDLQHQDHGWFDSQIRNTETGVENSPIVNLMRGPKDEGID